MTRYFALVCHLVSICIQRDGHGVNSCQFGSRQDGSVYCCHNYFRDGNVCRECPPGYFGFNCSQICPELSYGHLCRLKCSNCTNCNHIYGCTQSTEYIKLDVSRKRSSSTRPANAIMSSMPSIDISDVLEKENSSVISLNGNKTPPEFHLRIIIYTTGSLISFVLILIIVREISNSSKILFPPTNTNKPHNSGVVENIYSEVSDVIDCVIPHEEIASSLLNVYCNDQDGVSENSEGGCKDCIYSTVFREKKETETNKEIFSPESVQSSTEFNKRELEIAVSDSSQDACPTFVQFVLCTVVSLNGNKTPPKFNLAIIIFTSGSLISFVILLIIVREISNFSKISSPPTIKKKPHNSGFVDNIYFEVSDVSDGVISREDIASSMLNVNSNDYGGVSEILDCDSKD
ncbi:uncharacterized protein LOC134257198 [Saccostrea cucullata]|uniref:uncharacterized protein LOC134257198 n=1 Tax=Saccostrea cuccullata TaxID=36930 RepID=UPI002ED5D0AC